jgi:hypothetical protein
MQSLLSSAAYWRSIRTGALVAVMSLASATVAAAQAVPNRESAISEERTRRAGGIAAALVARLGP